MKNDAKIDAKAEEIQKERRTLKIKTSKQTVDPEWPWPTSPCQGLVF